MRCVYNFIVLRAPSECLFRERLALVLILKLILFEIVLRALVVLELWLSTVAVLLAPQRLLKCYLLMLSASPAI